MNSPYSNLPARNFWKTGVSEQHPLTVTDLYKKRFAIGPNDRIATAGSCFAQHIAVHLRKHGYQVIDAEPAPPGLDPETAREFGYGIFSARYANIYSTRQLLQLAREAYGDFKPHNPVWERGGRYYDAQRPSVEPKGLGSAAEVLRHRESHLRWVRSVFESANIFVFTFGLTEAWMHEPSGTVYPTAPGTIAGSYDASEVTFKNFTFAEIYSDFVKFRKLLKAKNPRVKFLLTVSPVPLTATASGDHVLVATTYSKSVLRAVAGQLYQELPDVDYFPSYEIVASTFSRAMFFESNLRAVNPGGVEQVMRVFFAEHGAAAAVAARPARQTDQTRQQIKKVARMQRRQAQPAPKSEEDVVCEDALLEAFAR